MYSREFLGNEPGGVTASQTKKKKRRKIKIALVQHTFLLLPLSQKEEIKKD